MEDQSEVVEPLAFGARQVEEERETHRQQEELILGLSLCRRR